MIYSLEILESTFFFFERLAGTPMNFSEYIRKKTKASNTYKSNWQGRDASEVTLRRGNIANKNNSTVHQGPDNVCCGVTYPGSTVTTITPGPGGGEGIIIEIEWITNTGLSAPGYDGIVTFVAGNSLTSYAYMDGLFNNPRSLSIVFTAPQVVGGDEIIVGLSPNDPIVPGTNYGTNLRWNFFITNATWLVATFSTIPPNEGVITGTVNVNNGFRGTHTVGNTYEIWWDGTSISWFVNNNLQFQFTPFVSDPGGYRPMVQSDGGVPVGSRIIFSNIWPTRPTPPEPIITTTTTGPVTIATAPKPPQAPGNGFSTDYSMDIVSNKRAGCANCSDTVWGTAGGVNLKSCAEVSTILSVPSNPIKGTNLTISPTNPIITSYCYCADPGVLPNNRGVVVASDEVNSTTISGQYTGWRNQVPARDNGSKRRQVIPYPSN